MWDTSIITLSQARKFERSSYQAPQVVISSDVELNDTYFKINYESARLFLHVILGLVLDCWFSRA